MACVHHLLVEGMHRPYIWYYMTWCNKRRHYSPKHHPIYGSDAACPWSNSVIHQNKKLQVKTWRWRGMTATDLMLFQIWLSRELWRYWQRKNVPHVGKILGRSFDWQALPIASCYNSRDQKSNAIPTNSYVYKIKELRVYMKDLGISTLTPIQVYHRTVVGMVVTLALFYKILTSTPISILWGCWHQWGAGRETGLWLAKRNQ